MEHNTSVFTNHIFCLFYFGVNFLFMLDWFAGLYKILSELLQITYTFFILEYKNLSNPEKLFVNLGVRNLEENSRSEWFSEIETK